MMLNTTMQYPNAVINLASASLSIRDLLYYAGLLSGLGMGAQAAADEQIAILNAQAYDGRTCVDGGSPFMFSLVALCTHPHKRQALGGNGLRVLTRSGPTINGVMPWLRTYYSPRGRVERWHSLAFIGEPATAWAHVQLAAERVGGLDILRRIHAILGPYSHLHNVNWIDTGVAPQAWVSWQLDRTLPADTALAVLNMKHAWDHAATLWESLLGNPPNPRLGPWSISILLGNEVRWRLGSTNWARRPEDLEKRRRLCTTIKAWGGDQRHAEAIYKLIISTAREGRPHSIGRAVELEFSTDGQPVLAEFYLIPPNFKD